MKRQFAISLIAAFCLLCAPSFAQDVKPSKEQTDKEKFNERTAEAQSRFDEQLKSGQERFDNQINNPGSKIKPKKEKKPKKERKPKPAKEQKEVRVSRDVVEIKPEPAQPQAKSGAFKQNAVPDADRVVRGIRTSAAVPIANITPERARSEAIRLAKEEALRIAVGEEINASTTVLDHGGEDATIARISTIGSRGGIISLQLTKDQQTLDASGASRYEVEIVVDVKIYPPITTPCISFEVTGVHHGYADGERLEFNVIPSDSCYVYLFLYDSRGVGTQLVPSAIEPKHCLQGQTATSFPINRAIQYTLTLDNPISTEELNTLLVVTFDRKVAITPGVCRDFEQTLCWIYSFEPVQRSRNIEVIPIRIYNKK